MHFDCMIQAGFNENQAMFFTSEFSKTVEDHKSRMEDEE